MRSNLDVMWFMGMHAMRVYDVEMKSNVLAALLTVAVFAGVGYLLMHENPAPSRSFERATTARPGGSLQGPTAAPPLIAPNDARPPDGHAGGVYRCASNGRVTYQDTPCTSGRQETISGGSVSVVPRHPTEILRRAPSDGGGSVAMVRRDEPPGEPSECAALRKRIKDIDAQARQRSTERLTEARRWAGKRMSALKCSAMD